MVPTQQVLSLWEEFKKFAFKGNVLNLAVAVALGTAFTNIINSLVKNVIMPLIGLLLPGEQGYLSWKITVGSAEVPYGLFLGEVVSFLIVSLALFLFIVKFLGWMMRTKKEEGPPPLTKDQELLSEIRDLLKKEQPGPA
ncbi:MAG: large conductance mechanosensitive channel protein MscL [Gemmataceae bacterium]|nr:large conductance mechanosensitive channel protein MscL [Gemmataceae bacterium]MCI0740641.1 large conductance mechanosensitive channel protein MscL [Gemmataceae bacterium]